MLLGSLEGEDGDYDWTTYTSLATLTSHFSAVLGTEDWRRSKGESGERKNGENDN